MMSFGSSQRLLLIADFVWLKLIINSTRYKSLTVRTWHWNNHLLPSRWTLAPDSSTLLYAECIHSISYRHLLSCDFYIMPYRIDRLLFTVWACFPDSYLEVISFSSTLIVYASWMALWAVNTYCIAFNASIVINPGSRSCVYLGRLPVRSRAWPALHSWRVHTLYIIASSYFCDAVTLSL